MKTKHKNTGPFMRQMKDTCESHGVIYKPVHDKYVEAIEDAHTQIRCRGYFNPYAVEGPTLSFATDLPFEIWFRIAIHEFTHVMQWIEKAHIHPPEERRNFHKWLDGKLEVTSETLKNTTSHLLECENWTNP